MFRALFARSVADLAPRTAAKAGRSVSVALPKPRAVPAVEAATGSKKKAAVAAAPAKKKTAAPKKAAPAKAKAVATKKAAPKKVKADSLIDNMMMQVAKAANKGAKAAKAKPAAAPKKTSKKAAPKKQTKAAKVTKAAAKSTTKKTVKKAVSAPAAAVVEKKAIEVAPTTAISVAEPAPCTALMQVTESVEACGAFEAAVEYMTTIEPATPDVAAVEQVACDVEAAHDNFVEAALEAAVEPVMAAADEASEALVNDETLIDAAAHFEPVELMAQPFTAAAAAPVQQPAAAADAQELFPSSVAVPTEAAATPATATSQEPAVSQESELWFM